MNFPHRNHARPLALSPHIILLSSSYYGRHNYILMIVITDDFNKVNDIEYIIDDCVIDTIF